MRAFYQLMRQTSKTLFGILLTALAVAAMCICLGQSLAAGKVEAGLQYDFTTVALPTPHYNYKLMKSGTLAFRPSMNEEVAAWIDEVIQSHPELVETVSRPGLASAYIPELTADHYLNHMYQRYYGTEIYGYINDHTPYFLPRNRYAAYVNNLDTAMLVVNLDYIGAAEEVYINMTLNQTDKDTGEKIRTKALETYEIRLKGTITQVVSLQEQLEDPVGRPITMKLVIPATQSPEDFDLTIGQSYMVFGLNYYDTAIETRQSYPGKNAGITLTLCDFAALPKFSYDDGSMLQTRSVDLGQGTTEIAWAEYMKMFGLPTISKIDGDVDSFLETHPVWKAQAAYSAINHDAYAVIGVDKLDYVADFTRGLSRVTQGRDFSQEELISGAKVCIISETVANLSGLTVGDTICPQFYNWVYSNPYQGYIKNGPGTVLPNAYYFNGQSELLDAESYTIIGLYRQNDEWGDAKENLYSFTPNTVFVPQNSLNCTVDRGNQGLFKTIVLTNGASEEFDSIVMDKTFETIIPLKGATEMFVYYDQGYSLVRESLHDYLELAKQVLIIGATVYGIILLLYLLLFPGRQGKVLRTMATMGTHRHKKIGYMLQNSLGILLPGSALGLAAAVVLWESVMSRLLARSDGSFSLELDVLSLCAITLAQFAAAMLLVTLLAIPMTAHSNLMKRK